MYLSFIFFDDELFNTNNWMSLNFFNAFDTSLIGGNYIDEYHKMESNHCYDG